MIVHNREASGRFDTYLGNGDPLNKSSVHEPSGRGPFSTWELGAIDALKLKNLHKIARWNIPRALYEFERYNGFGYALKGLPSPYLWAGSSIYKKGKYVADHVFDPDVVDEQLGAATMLQALFSLGLLNSVLGGGGAGNGAGVTVSNTTTTTNLLGVVMGAVMATLGTVGFGVDAFHVMSFGAGIVVALAAAINQLHLTSGSNANTVDLVAQIAAQIKAAAEAQEAKLGQPDKSAQPVPPLAISSDTVNVT